MSDTIRQRLVDKVKTRFQGIKKASGYNSDLGLNVIEWPTSPIADNELPALILRDGRCDTDMRETHRHKLHFEADVVTKESEAPAEVRRLIADVLKAIGVDVQWDNLALNTYPQDDALGFDQAKKKIGGAKINFYIEFRTKEWDPYTIL